MRYKIINEHVCSPAGLEKTEFFWIQSFWSEVKWCMKEKNEREEELASLVSGFNRL